MPRVRHGRRSARARLNDTDVVVLGAGLTGVTAALELARDGVDVTLMERDERPLNRTSRRNEGKIHVGFVFAHDDSLATASLMIDGALSFRALLEPYLGEDTGALGASHPFTYLIPHDSLLPPAEIERRFGRIEERFRERLARDPNLDYLGERPQHLFEPVALRALEPHLATRSVAAAFRTAEVAVDTHRLADALEDAVAREPRIRFLPGRRAEAVERRDGGFAVRGSTHDGPWRIVCRQVVNATWESRFALDRSAGLEPPRGWLHRLKYRVVARVPERMRDGPSVTMIVGKYGDVVIRPDATAYFSWYPLGLRGWTHDPAPPAEWDAPCRGDVSAGDARAVAQQLLGAIDRWYPGAAQAEPLTVDAGAIVAYGATDVDDPASGLHDRTRVGVVSAGGYHSVDPGKLTTAPLFGARAARAVLAARTAV